MFQCSAMCVESVNRYDHASTSAIKFALCPNPTFKYLCHRVHTEHSFRSYQVILGAGQHYKE